MSTPITVMLPPDLGQVAFGLQGSGSLGADQVAVDQALHEAGVEPRLGHQHIDRRDQRQHHRGQQAYQTRVGTHGVLAKRRARSVPTGTRNTPLRGRGHRSGSL